MTTEKCYPFQPGITVRELLERLKDMPPDLPVVYHDDWTEMVVTGIEVEQVWDGVSQDDGLQTAYLKGRYAHTWDLSG